MKFLELNKSDKLLLSTADIANLLAINKNSANVTASRYVKNGLLIRIKKDFYIPSGRFDNLSETDLFRLSNIIQTPSYISLGTALCYYNISTQQQRNFTESIALKRTKKVRVKYLEFNYTIIKKELYFGFERINDFFIATPEKALADAIYLCSIKRYTLDFEAIDFGKINKQKVDKFTQTAGDKTQKYWKVLCKIYKISKYSK